MKTSKAEKWKEKWYNREMIQQRNDTIEKWYDRKRNCKKFTLKTIIKGYHDSNVHVIHFKTSKLFNNPIVSHTNKYSCSFGCFWRKKSYFFPMNTLDYSQNHIIIDSVLHEGTNTMLNESKASFTNKKLNE